MRSPINSAPRVKLTYGLCCAKEYRPRRATGPDFPASAASPKGTGKL